MLVDKKKEGKKVIPDVQKILISHKACFVFRECSPEPQQGSGEKNHFTCSRANKAVLSNYSCVAFALFLL